MSIDPRTAYPQPPFPTTKQSMPGGTQAIEPKPDHGEESYKGSGRLAGKAALITGGDSSIGRAIAVAFAREGADVLSPTWTSTRMRRNQARGAHDKNST